MVSVFFGAAVKGQYMEDLLGSLLPTTVSQNEPKISLHGVEMSQPNATYSSLFLNIENIVMLCKNGNVNKLLLLLLLLLL